MCCPLVEVTVTPLAVDEAKLISTPMSESTMTQRVPLDTAKATFDIATLEFANCPRMKPGKFGAMKAG
jgi:hypothetical protein